MTSIPSSDHEGAVFQRMVHWYHLNEFDSREARLLDAEDYDAWLELLTEDVHYWMPARETVFRKEEAEPDPGNMNLYHETLTSLRVRAHRLKTGTAWSENPRTRFRHLITNIELRRVEPSGDWVAASNFLVYRNRLEREEAWMVGSRDDVLRPAPDGTLRLARRRILLDQNSLLSKNLNVYL